MKPEGTGTSVGIGLLWMTLLDNGLYPLNYFILRYTLWFSLIQCSTYISAHLEGSLTYGAYLFIILNQTLANMDI